MASNLISIVIPLFNKESYIYSSLKSVCNQTIADFEIIVIDDGSTDKSADIVEDFKDPRIKFFRQENAGECAARNAGIEKANSELIAFLDADDTWKPWFLETILRLHKKFPEAGAYATNYAIIEPNEKILVQTYNSLPPSPWEGILKNYFKFAAQGEVPLSASSVCIPKDVFADVGGFPVGERRGGDLDMWCRIALKYPIAYSTKICATYHRDADNRACFIMTNTEGPVLKTLRNEMQNKHKINQKINLHLRKYFALIQIKVAKRLILDGQFKKARVILREKITYHHFSHRLCLLLLTILPKDSIKFAMGIKSSFKEKYFVSKT